VHRDFKPSNVLVQDDHAKVTDFGLALFAGAAPEVTTGETPSSSGASSRVTRAGATPGTPEYMAPEQFRGQFDARSDQFSFARSLENALVGRQAPGWLEAPLRRALSADPEARFPSMTELLAAISPEPRAQRRRLAVGAVLAVVLVGVAVGAFRARRVDCSTASAALEAVWSSEAKAALETRASVLPSASAARVRAAFSSWADDWSQRARTSCEASAAGKQSEKVELLRGLCLERRLTFFRTLTQGLTAELGAEQLVSAADSLKPGGCSDEALIADGSAEESPALREKLEPLRVQLQKVEALTLIGRSELALSEVSSCLEQAREVGFGPFTAQPAVLKGQFFRREDPTQARALFREAYLLANVPQSSDETQRVAARAAIEYLDTFESTPETLAALQAMTEGALARVGNTESSEASYLSVLGKAALARGDAKAAIDTLTRAHVLREKLEGPDAADTLLLVQNLALAFSLSGDSERAVALFEDRVKRLEARFGADSLPYARALAQLGAEEVVAVRYDGARKHLQTASAVLSKNGVELGRESDLLDNLASMLEIDGDFAGARRVREKLLEFEKAPLTRAKYLGLMSRVLVELGDVEGTRRDATEAIATLEKANPGHPDLQVPLTALGRVTAGARGAALLERALNLPRAVDHEYRGDVLRAMAERATGTARSELLERARNDYAEGQVTFRVRELDGVKR